MKLNFKNSKRMGIVIGIILFLSLVAGITYAWLSFTSNSMAISGTSKCFNINYTNGGDVSGDIGPISENDFFTNDTFRLSAVMAYTSVSLELDSECDPITAIGTIELNVSNLSDKFINGEAADSLKYVVAEFNASDYDDLDYDTIKNEEFTYIRKGIINSTGTMDIHYEYLKPGEVHDYLIVVYIDKNVMSKYYTVIGEPIDISVSARAKQFDYTPISDFTYELGTDDLNGYIILKSYTGTNPMVVVNDTYSVNNVTYTTALKTGDAGHNGTFYNNQVIDTVYLPQNVSFVYSAPWQTTYQLSTSAGYLFARSTVKRVPIIPSSVTSMSYTFQNCISLVTAPVIPNSVTDMSNAFSGCTSLVTAPVIPNSVTDMTSTFSGCTSLVTAPVIPNSVTDMTSAFSGCTSLVTAPVIPNSVTSMSYAFYNCTNLAGIVRINSSTLSFNNSSNPNPFKNTVKSIIAEVPAGSTTYTTLNATKPANVTVVGY